jgi:acyl-CoA synthetase (AMP-forming)/AMP-acid ligase II
MIKTGGVNVYPAEIEPVIAAHAHVHQAAVIGIPDAEWGEKVVACVVPRGECTEAEILEFCKDKLAAYKRPKMVRFLDELPSNAIGKIVKDDLKAMLVGDGGE